MSKLRFFLVICLLSFYLFTGCSSDTTPPTAIENPAGLYNAAVESFSATDEYSAEISHIKTTKIGDQVFHESALSNVFCSAMTTNKPYVDISQDLYYTSAPISSQLIYQNDTAYLKLGSVTFSQAIPAETFLADYVGFEFPDFDSFESVKAVQTADTTVISLYNPSDFAVFSLPANARSTDATVLMQLDSQNLIHYFHYQLAYQLDGKICSETYSVSFSYSTMGSVSYVPDDVIQLESIDLPLLLERSCGFLQQTNSITSESTNVLTSQITGITRAETCNITKVGHRDQMDAEVQINVTLTDPSRGGDVSQLSQFEQFKDGIYQVSSNNESFSKQPEITAESFENYCYNLLLESILLPQYISQAAVTQDDTFIRIDFKATDDLASVIASNTFQSLYSDIATVNDLTASCHAESITAYLLIDINSGLPTSSGLHFEGVHITDNVSYTVSSDTNQTYQYP